MEQNGNQNLPPATLCRMGCGFYGNAAFDGMCSKCYKDVLKRKQNSSSPVSNGRISPVNTTTEAATEKLDNMTATLAQTTLSSKHKANITRHAPVSPIDNFMTKSINSSTRCSTTEVISSNPSTSATDQKTRSPQSSLQVCSANVLRAELLWVMKCVDSHYSASSSCDVNQLLKTMFPDSSIAASFGCSERKASYRNTFGLGPYFASQLQKNIGTASDYILLFDETLNTDVQEKQLDIYLRFWKDSRVICKFFDSAYMGHAAASDLFSKLRPLVSKFRHHKLLQLSMDGPNVILALAGEKPLSSDSASALPSIKTASPTVSTPGGSSQDREQCEEGAEGGADISDGSSDSSGEKDKKPKKNRCHACRKKVGLTGFECRCGGLYCSLHRYSDKHDCPFDYKEHGQKQIRRNNPVIVGSKIQKI